MAPALPLDDVCVVDMTRNVAGPYAAMILAELGADVIKVEAPGAGDDTREWGPPFWNSESPVFLALNRNKRSIELDLKEPSARIVVERLVKRADILFESFRPGSLERLGYGYDRISSLNPGLVYCSVTAYGGQGPLSDAPGYDPLLQARCGIMSVTGEPGRPPVRVGVPLIDMGTGMWAALAALAALTDRRRTGRGSLIVTSLYETAVAWMAYHFTNFWASGELPRRQGSGTTMIAPYDVVRTRDGQLVVAAANDRLFGRLAEVLGHPEWAGNPLYRRNRDRVKNRDALMREVESVTSERSTDELDGQLVAAGIPCSRILDVAQVASAPQTLALGLIQTADHPAIADFRSIGLPFAVGGSRPALRRPPPSRGQHTLEILGELGFDSAEIGRLQRSGSVAAPRAEAAT